MLKEWKIKPKNIKRLFPRQKKVFSLVKKTLMIKILQMKQKM